MKFCVLTALLVGACASRRGSSSWVNLANEVKNGLFVQQTLRGDRDDPEAAMKDAHNAVTDHVAERPPKDTEVSEDYNKETAVVGGTVTWAIPLPASVEFMLATIWCLMIAVIPYVLVKYNNAEVTNLIIIEGCLLLVWLAGGIFAFTKVILFHGAHWEGVRTLTMVESTYLLTQILTTIGYGDITPAFPRGQVVCAFYIILSLIVVSNMFSQVVELIQMHLEEDVERTKGDFCLEEEVEVVKERLGHTNAELLEAARKERAPSRFDFVQEPPANGWPVLKAFCIYALAASIGTCFFHWYPGENKSWMEATYMSLVTLSTVGFGAFTATTEVGKAFASFWMLFGVAALGNFASCCIVWSYQKKAFDANAIATKDLSWQQLLGRMDTNSDDHVNSEDFLKFALVHAGYATEEQIEKIAHFYRKMHPDSNGVVPLKKFQALGAPEAVKTPRSGRRS